MIPCPKNSSYPIELDVLNPVKVRLLFLALLTLAGWAKVQNSNVIYQVKPCGLLL